VAGAPRGEMRDSGPCTGTDDGAAAVAGGVCGHRHERASDRATSSCLSPRGHLWTDWGVVPLMLLLQGVEHLRWLRKVVMFCWHLWVVEWNLLSLVQWLVRLVMGVW